MKRNNSRKGGIKRGRNVNDVWVTDTRDVVTLSNDAFEAYYKDNVVSSSEWEPFMSALRRPLPTALRVQSAGSWSTAVSVHVRSQLDGIVPTVTIPFIPNDLAFQCTLSRGDLKRTAGLKEVKRLIATLNDGGYLTRQETVSMIPVVLLQVAPEHRVLDMCAAPGSKTSQILEALKLSEERGVVVANDLNSSRLDVLLHQTGRIAGAHKHLVVTNYDATRFPLLSNGDKFDRVLCDVMCSGDGTLRKSMDMWPRWNTVHGADLHITQVRVLTRGMMLCKKGGIVVYSTCSLNPVEDEAVVSECLSQAQGSFRLIDPEPLLKDFITVPGQMKWFLLSKDLTQRFATFEEAQAYNNAQEGGGFRYRESMFPSTERLREQNIHFARRVLPHHQDTGGFFFAVMECVSDYPQGEVVESAGSTKQPLNICSATLQNQVRKALNLPESFPLSQIYVRNENAREQKFYLACEAVCELYGKLGSRIVHVGSRVFESRVKYSNDALRFCTQDVGSLLSLLPAECVVEVEPEFVLRLSQSGTLPASSFPSPLPPYPSFLISCRTSLVGPIYIAADAKYPGQIGAKVAEWQQTLVRLTLGLSITDSPGRSDEGDNDCGTEG